MFRREAEFIRKRSNFNFRRRSSKKKSMYYCEVKPMKSSKLNIKLITKINMEFKLLCNKNSAKWMMKSKTNRERL